ncbi:CopY/TcrY family copper transport repressor [Lactovum miscens]|uniref:CopY/TcrY family copper transport repressor n=1 Tax=Lactovum miscens TaxID=190387 RepID=A0A841C915_9LACT|nr:CopY/TcrY family copper transport repressor [Lactovum miscens]MBB5887879.1 CopY/TcrY family copper transport repressor [Lactovum miscens]
MKEQELNISNAEMVIMRVIWSLNGAKVEEVMRQISKRQNWSLATVKTLMGRLVKKEVLTTEKEGRAFVYRAAMSECDAIRQMTGELLEKICATKESEFLSDAIDLAKLKQSDIDNLIKQLQEKVATETVSCDCLDDNNCSCVHNQIISK